MGGKSKKTGRSGEGANQCRHSRDGSLGGISESIEERKSRGGDMTPEEYNKWFEEYERGLKGSMPDGGVLAMDRYTQMVLLREALKKLEEVV